jgi:hypothetical protein
MTIVSIASLAPSAPRNQFLAKLVKQLSRRATLHHSRKQNHHAFRRRNDKDLLSASANLKALFRFIGLPWLSMQSRRFA